MCWYDSLPPIDQTAADPGPATTIDPYDPSSFGFVEVGRIERPHGVNGEVKVRAVTDFGVQRLCTPGMPPPH